MSPSDIPLSGESTSPRPMDIWGPRQCPRCGAPPGQGCRTPSGKRAGLPHRERYPEGPKRTKRPDQLRKPQPEPERPRRTYSHLPVRDAVKAHTNDQMREWRERRAA